MKRGPHWLLNDQDARQYGQALANAVRHLPVVVAQKYFDYAALAGAIAMHEGPRVTMDIAIAAERRAGRRPTYAQPAQVFQFGPRPAAPPPPPQGPMAQPAAQQPGPTPDMTYEPEIPEGAA